MKEATFIVYKHTCPNGKCYIGITGRSAGARWNYGHGYDSQLFGRAVRKYGWENIKHEVLFDSLSLEEAYEKERECIKRFKSNDINFGYNCDNGGAGAEGHQITEEARQKMSEHAKEMWGYPQMRERLVNHLHEISEANKGRKRAASAIQKTAEALSIPILQYDKSFNLIAEHSSMMNAARSIGKEENGLICRVCLQKWQTAYGFYWRYKTEPITQEEIEEISKPKPKYNARPICQFTKDGEFVARYGNIHEAGRVTGFSYKGIWNALSNRRPSAYGYKWQYAV